MTNSSLTRRAVLAGAAAGVATGLASPAVAQARPVRFTLPWLAEGNYLYLIAGKQKGIFARHGIDIDISRGFGSLPAGQAIASGQFDFGVLLTMPVILLVASGLPLMSIATMDYEDGMGVGVLADSPIVKPSMLAGKRIGDVPTSAEFPFFPAYARKIGVDVKGIEFVNTDNKVLERVLAQRQVDAMTGIAASSLPVFMSKDIPVRWMLYSSVGMPSCGTSIVTTRSMLAKDRALCGAMVDAACESLAFALNNPDEATALFLQALPEMTLNPNIASFLRVGSGLHDLAVAKPEARSHGLGYGDQATLARLVDLFMQNVATPKMTRPAVADWYVPGFGGKVSLTQAEWSRLDARVAPLAKLLT